jgi:hypothetical protein
MIRKFDSRLLLLCALFALLAAACQTPNPVAVAETAEQKAFAIYGTYVVFSEQAAILAATPTIPASVRLGLVNAEGAAKPSADALKAAYDQAVAIAKEVAVGTSPQERYTIALTNLNRWITDASPTINALKAAVEGARK